ncbi:MAG: hypothetical protein JXK93_10820 [Sphaerochaetaceae bacterium]|nr:hypothetical protein [Sphaerochaetaceae bacterium]
MKKTIIVGIVIALLAVSAVNAASPSTFDFGVLNYYRLSDLSETDFTPYTPGLRFEGHITPWFGVGTDVLLDAPFEGSGDIYTFLMTTDLTVRATLGFFEPFFGFGPAYKLVLDGGSAALAADVAYNARAGFDFNITDVFTLGVEAKLLLEHLPLLVDGTNAFADVDWMESTFVGLGVKLKL